ncbi:MAG TPA: phosphatase PAP2 family protein [Capsulimonadaceae bacterium]
MKKYTLSLPHPPRHNSILRWWLPALAFTVLVPLCYVGILPGQPWHRIADFIGHTINTAIIVATFIVVGVTAYRRRGTPSASLAWWMLDTPLVMVLLGDIWKLLVHAPRPDHRAAMDGFPSGHTMAAFALAYVVTEIDPRLGVLWYIIAAAMGWSRVECGAHYPYQVIIGALMGIAMGTAVCHLAKGVLAPRLYHWLRARRQRPKINLDTRPET